MIKTIKHIAEIKDILSTADRNALILFDIDETIIMTLAKMFRFNSKHRHFINEIKSNHKDIPKYEEILSSWRLSRKSILVSPEWPMIINDLKSKVEKIYALTQMDTGKFGKIDRIEQWRYEELIMLGINFSEKFIDKEEEFILPGTDDFAHEGLYSPAIFYKGFFMTGANTKGNVVKEILAKLPSLPSQIIFLDDRMDHVQDINKVCELNNIPYQGIVYRGVELFEEVPVEEIVDYQKKHLFENFAWLEDEQVEEILSKSKNTTENL